MSFMGRFMRRLDELGYKNGQNLRLIYRSAEGQPHLMSGLASELVGMKPDVLVTGLGTVAARAAKSVTDSVPVVFMSVGDPVGANIVESLARPGANVTGLSDPCSTHSRQTSCAVTRVRARRYCRCGDPKPGYALYRTCI